MHVESRPFLCRLCNERFNLETLQDVLVDVWVTHIKTLHCPKCGASWRKLSFLSDIAGGPARLLDEERIEGGKDE